MRIPYHELSSTALRLVVEEFVTRDGTDHSSEDLRVDTVLQQLVAGNSRVVLRPRFKVLQYPALEFREGCPRKRLKKQSSEQNADVYRAKLSNFIRAEVGQTLDWGEATAAVYQIELNGESSELTEPFL